MSDKPEIITIPTNGALSKLRDSVDSAGVMDVEILLAQAIDCMISPAYLSEEVALLGERISDMDDSICQATQSIIDGIDLSIRKEITCNLSILIENVTAQLKQHRLYDGPFFHYEFARIGDEDSIIVHLVK